MEEANFCTPLRLSFSPVFSKMGFRGEIGYNFAANLKTQHMFLLGAPSKQREREHWGE